MFPAQKNDRKRYPLQWEKMQYMSKTIRNWRNLSKTIKDAWSTFAATYRYQLFLKRYFYYFMHEGITEDFNLYPELAQLPDPEFSVDLIEDGPCIDVTPEYIRNFGILPEVGQFVICRIIPISANSAQFFAPLVATLEVKAVYMDGLMLSFDFSANFDNIVFSLYLSKPVWESVKYPGTKFRYMGCFKPTNFIQLSDTPETYEGQAGKKVVVNETEDAVIFTDDNGCEYCLPTPTEADAGKVVTVNPDGDGYINEESGGGSFDCDDLLECNVFTELQSQIDSIINWLTNSGQTSIPPINFGLLYNRLAILDTRQLLPDGFSVPTKTQWSDLFNYFPSSVEAAYALCEKSPNYWLYILNNTNSAHFNARGAGTRRYNDYAFYGLLSFSYYHVLDYTTYAARIENGITNPLYYYKTTSGLSVRALKTNLSAREQTLPDFASGNPVTGHNGNIYRTVKINGFIWLADNLAETHYKNGDAIPQITDATEWKNATTGAMCAYDNEWSNV